MKLYLIAGEASGDARGAEVMRSLIDLTASQGTALEFYGAGGPQMQALAPTIQDWSGEAVVGLWDVLKKYGYFRRQFAAMLAEIAEVRPDAVVFIDYPGFNLRLAKALRKAKTPARLFYYISPQVWAWNQRRIPQMARTLDLMLCIFPFEKVLYEKSGLPTVFVGHPMLDTLAAKKGSTLREPGLIGLFPGSRTKEVSRIFPVMVETAAALRKQRPELRFETAAASSKVEALMREILEAYCEPDRSSPWKQWLTIRSGGSHELMQQSAVGMVASGTATMEAAFFEMPFTILYRVAPLTWEVGKRLVKVPFLGMVNILAGRALVAEYLQHAAEPRAVSKEVMSLLDDPAKREAQVAGLREVIKGLGEGGAGLRAAEAIVQALGR